MHEFYKGAVDLEDANDILSAYHIFRVPKKFYYLCTELFIARGEIRTTTWFSWCQKAIKVLSQSGIKYVKISQIVVDWHTEFRVSNQFKFPCENKKKLPHLWILIKIQQMLYCCKARRLWGIQTYWRRFFTISIIRFSPTFWNSWTHLVFSSTSILLHCLIMKKLMVPKIHLLPGKNIIIKETDGSIKKEHLFRRYGLCCVC